MNHVCLFICSQCPVYKMCVIPFLVVIAFSNWHDICREWKEPRWFRKLFARKLWPPMRIFLIAMRGAPLLNRSLSNDFKLSTHRSFMLDGPVRQIIGNQTCFCELSSLEFGNRKYNNAIDWNSICFTVLSRFVIDPEIMEFHQSV